MPPAARGISASTRVVALLGHPVAHSVSPQIHNAAFAATGFDAVYVATDVPAGDVVAALRGLEALGFLGANVTVPHKQAVYAAVLRRTEEARACGAGNTLFFDDGRLTLDNTDVEGLRRVLVDDVGLAAGEQVTLFGAGGAARAAAVALGRLGAAVTVVARRDAAAAQVQQLALEAGAANGGDAAPPRLVVNATPLGLHGEALPEPFAQLEAGQTALDLVYGPVDTPFVAAARAAGAQAFDGRGMLVHQAALAFHRWTGTEAPLDVMHAAAVAALNSAAQPEDQTRR